MKKILYAIIGGYLALTIAVVAWMFGCPKSYGRFLSKWQDKVTEGMEED